MRKVLTAFTIAMGLVSLSSLSFAADRSSGEHWRKSKYSRSAYEQKLRRQQDAADELRASYLDPAGNYKSYPAWARAALSPKSDGGNRM